MEKPENPFPTKIKIKSLNIFKILKKLRLLKLIKENNFNGSKNIDLGSNEDFPLPLNGNNVEDIVDFLVFNSHNLLYITYIENRN